MTLRFAVLAALLALTACGSDQPAAPPPVVHSTEQPMSLTDSVETPEPTEVAKVPPPQPKPQSPTLKPEARSPKSRAAIPSEFTDVTVLDPSIRLDIRYATTDNFTKAKIYDCPRCLLRPEAAQALVKAHKALQKKGLGLKMFDCYRPRPYQQRLWDKVPNPDYVTPPAKGSMHSRGAAVDLTIVDERGRELDMGTEYDFFGREAHTDYMGHSAKVQANRDLLRETLATVGFKGIRTEWWHFSFQGKDYPLSDYVWPCGERVGR